jgi:hypothetical protein
MDSQIRNRISPYSEADGLSIHRSIEALKIARISSERLTSLAEGLGGKGFKLTDTPLLELSARQPYDAARGNMDVYKPGRWDTTSNLIYMDPIVQTGPNPGEWDGTVIYASFNPAQNGTYLIVGNFSGFDTTMRLFGPWGTQTAHTDQVSDAGAVVALWSGGDPLSFTMSCLAPIIGYTASIQVFAQ